MYKKHSQTVGKGFRVRMLSQTKIDLRLMQNKYSFHTWVHEKRIALGLTQAQLAKLAKTTKQTISSIERQAPHPISGALYRPTVEMVDQIAEALNESKTEARLSASYLPEDYEENFNVEEQRLIKYFTELPRECQLDVLALTEALWRRRRTAKKPLPLSDNVREVPKPQELPDHKRRVS
jgi:transcriptional regulator with XRE-family HTH domain